VHVNTQGAFVPAIVSEMTHKKQGPDNGRQSFFVDRLESISMAAGGSLLSDTNIDIEKGTRFMTAWSPTRSYFAVSEVAADCISELAQKSMRDFHGVDVIELGANSRHEAPRFVEELTPANRRRPSRSSCYALSAWLVPARCPWRLSRE